MPTNANAIEAAIAIKIVMVKACAKRGEKVFNAYMIFTPFVLNCWLVMGWLARLGCSLSALLLSIVTNGVSPHRVMAALYAHKTKVSSFFLNFFFDGCERLGVGAWVWALGSVGGGGGMRMGGHGIWQAGLGLAR